MGNLKREPPDDLESSYLVTRNTIPLLFHSVYISILRFFSKKNFAFSINFTLQLTPSNINLLAGGCSFIELLRRVII